MNRREFLHRSVSGAVVSGASLARLPAHGGESRRGRGGARELRIERILVQPSKGRRLTPVAPNAYAPYRGYGGGEPILRVQTAQGLEGIARHLGVVQPEQLSELLNLDPFELFEWDGDVVLGPEPSHAKMLSDLGGTDVALFDLLGQALDRPIAALLGQPVRDRVKLYDSSLYMEDLLQPDQRDRLAYLQNGPAPEDPVEMVARKLLWLLERPEGIRHFKIKTGRARWMDPEDWLERDIAVVNTCGGVAGKDATLLVDGNNGYEDHPEAAVEFALAVADQQVYLLEEMFPEEMVPQARELKHQMRMAGIATKLADGETKRDGIPEHLREQRFFGPDGEEPLYDIDQADMNINGYLRLARIARACAAHGMTVAPHNFGSKMGLYAMIHLGLVTPNWEFCEGDDTQVFALRSDGIAIENGSARLTGAPGLGVRLDEEHLEKPTLELET